LDARAMANREPRHSGPDYSASWISPPAFGHTAAATKVVCNGVGYTGEQFEHRAWQILGAKVQVAKRNELHKFVVIPKRWVVERSFAWLEKCRRLWKNCERKLNTSLQFVVLAFIALLLRRH
jgi:transposase